MIDETEAAFLKAAGEIQTSVVGGIMDSHEHVHTRDPKSLVLNAVGLVANLVHTLGDEKMATRAYHWRILGQLCIGALAHHRLRDEKDSQKEENA